ncbi:MAG: LuxR family transcriptional regulator [Paracoccaceae bacterium]
MGKTTVSDVLSLLSRIAEATTVRSVWDLATGHFAGLGFGRVNYGFTRFLGERGIDNPEDAVFLTTADADYVRHYFASGLFARTPAFRWAQQNSGACTWGWIDAAFRKGELSADEAAAVEQNARMGITAGLTVSFPETSTRSKGALGMIADPGLDHAAVDAIWEANRQEILALANMMHLKIVNMPGANGRRPLTQRQREALEWVADGKTTQDVAVLMGVSPAMVEKHLRLAREALEVETTAQAVAKAALLNMIFHKDGGERHPLPRSTAAR